MMFRNKASPRSAYHHRIALLLLLAAAAVAFVGQSVVATSPMSAAPWFSVAIVLGALAAAIQGPTESRFTYPLREPLRLRMLALFVLAGVLALGSFYASSSERWGTQLPAVIWIASIIIGLLAFTVEFKQREKHPTENSVVVSRKWVTWELVVAFSVLVIALLLRVVELERFPLAVHNDEANCGLMGQEILREWHAGNVDWFRIRDFYQFNTVGFLPSALFQGFFPPSLYGHRLANAVWGTAALIPFYLLVRDLFGKFSGIIALTLAATAHFSIHWSRTGIHCGHVPFLAAMAMWFLWKGLTTGKYKWFALLGVTLTLCLLTYGAAQVIPLCVAIVVGTYWVTLRNFRRTYTLPLLITAIMVMITAAPFIDLYMRSPHAFFSRSSSLVWTSDQSSIRHMQSIHGEDYFKEILKQHTKKSLLLFNQTPDHNAQYGFRFGGLLDEYTAPIFVVGLGVMLPQLCAFTHWPFVLFLALNIALGSIFTTDPAQYGRLAGLAFVMGIPTALWFRELYYSARGAFGKLGSSVVIVAALAFIALVAIENFRLYFARYDISRGDDHEASIHLIAEDVASRGPTNKTFVLHGSFPTDFTFQSHRFIAGKLLAEAFKSVDTIVFPADQNIKSLTVIVPLSKPELIDALAERFPGGTKEMRRLSYRQPSDFYWIFSVPERTKPT